MTQAVRSSWVTVEVSFGTLDTTPPENTPHCVHTTQAEEGVLQDSCRYTASKPGYMQVALFAGSPNFECTWKGLHFGARSVMIA